MSCAIDLALDRPSVGVAAIIGSMSKDIPIDGWAKAETSMPTAGSVEELAAFERILVRLFARLANVTAAGVETEIQLASHAHDQSKKKQFSHHRPIQPAQGLTRQCEVTLAGAYMSAFSQCPLRGHQRT
jgi:hypothetical protein